MQRPNLNSAPQKTVALLVETSRAYGCGICRGVAQFTQQYSHWLIIYQERNLKQSIPDFLTKHAGEILRAEENGFLEIDAIAKWLTRLPKPIALFACNDVRALQVAQACHIAGCSVPDEVSVLGVDNDEIITELCHPKLSSIQPDTVSTGYKACVCLDRMMNGMKPELSWSLVKKSIGLTNLTIYKAQCPSYIGASLSPAITVRPPEPRVVVR